MPNNVPNCTDIAKNRLSPAFLVLDLNVSEAFDKVTRIDLIILSN